MSVSPSAHMEQLGSHWMDFNEIWYLNIIRGCVEKIQVSLYMTIITGTLHEDLCVFVMISPWILLRMRKSQTTTVKSIKTHILASIPFFWKSCRYEIMWKTPEHDRPKTTCWITKATDTHLEYVRLIAFPRHQWLRERALMLRCTYVVIYTIIRKKEHWFFLNTICWMVFVMVTRLVYCEVLAKGYLVYCLDQMNV